MNRSDASHCCVVVCGLALLLSGCGITPTGDDNPDDPGRKNPEAFKLAAPDIGLSPGEGRYRWFQTAGPAGTLDDATSDSPVFTIPGAVDDETEFVFVVDVSYGDITTPYEVLTRVRPDATRTGNRPPEARAGEFKTARVGETVVLNAGNSFDPDGDDLTYAWRQVGFAQLEPDVPVDLSRTDTAGATFTATQPGAYLFEVRVFDGQYTVSHTMAVSVFGFGLCADVACLPGSACDIDTGTCMPACPAGQLYDPSVGACQDRPTVNRAPIAAAGADQEVDAGVEVILDGSDSSDPDGDALICTWEQVSGQEVVLAAPESCVASFVAPVEDVSLTLVFELTVRDGELEDRDEVVVATLATTGCGDPPSANAGADVDAEGGDLVRLNGANSFDPEGEVLVFQWTQVTGPSVILDDPTSPEPTFLAPLTLTTTELVFELQVVDGGCSDLDRVTVTVAPATTGQVTAQWRSQTGNVNADIYWQLPNGAYVDVSRNGWSTTGVESARLHNELIPDGFHLLELAFETGGAVAEVTYDVRLFGFSFSERRQAASNFKAIIGVDVRDGVAVPVFNSWKAFDDMTLQSSGHHQVEILTGWQDSDGQVNVDITLLDPDGANVATRNYGWSRQGIERIVIPDGVLIKEGTYKLKLLMETSSARASHVSYVVDFLDHSVRYDRLMNATQVLVIGIDVSDGVATPFFDGWLSQADDGAEQITGRHPFEVVAGWREASDQVNVDTWVRTPSGEQLEIRRSGWSFQNFERTFVPSDTPLDDGEYRLTCQMSAANRNWAEVGYFARFLDWEFQFQDRLAGNNEFIITLLLEGGVVTEIGNTWP